MSGKFSKPSTSSSTEKSFELHDILLKISSRQHSQEILTTKCDFTEGIKILKELSERSVKINFIENLSDTSDIFIIGASNEMINSLKPIEFLETLKHHYSVTFVKFMLIASGHLLAFLKDQLTNKSETIRPKLQVGTAMLIKHLYLRKWCTSEKYREAFEIIFHSMAKSVTDLKIRLFNVLELLKSEIEEDYKMLFDYALKFIEEKSPKFRIREIENYGLPETEKVVYYSLRPRLVRSFPTIDPESIAPIFANSLWLFNMEKVKKYYEFYNSQEEDIKKSIDSEIHDLIVTKIIMTERSQIKWPQVKQLLLYFAHANNVGGRLGSDDESDVNMTSEMFQNFYLLISGLIFQANWKESVKGVVELAGELTKIAKGSKLENFEEIFIHLEAQRGKFGEEIDKLLQKVQDDYDKAVQEDGKEVMEDQDSGSESDGLPIPDFYTEPIFGNEECIEYI